MREESRLTGRPSVDRPWMKFYPEGVRSMTVPKCSLTEYLERNCIRKDLVAIEYYGHGITWQEIFDNADTAAKALKALGFGEGDQIPVFLQAVPEFIMLLLAAEKIGASVLCRDGEASEYVEAIRKSGSSVLFFHDFLSAEDEKKFMEEAGMKRAVLLSPYTYAKKEQMPAHNAAYIDSLYPEHKACQAVDLNWEGFMELGRTFTGTYQAKADCNRPLLRAFTTGTTGDPKQVIHSAASMIGILFQMGAYGSAGEIRINWLHTILPPSLIAVVVSMMLSPLSSNKLLILDPFVSVDDLDLELMHYKPNCWPMIPMFIEILMRSERIPADYDMSHLFASGAGAEAFNNSQIRRAHRFLKEHNSKAFFSVGYGQSEAGSNCTFPCPAVPLENGNSGIPMPLTTIAIFEEGTHQELGYNQKGEVCVSSPGLMLGYDNPQATAKTLQKHEDGRTWLHTGDMGYMSKEGVVYVLNRGVTQRFGGGRLAALPLENKVVGIEGIDDAFFVIVPDEEHEGYYLPYLYVILEKGYTVEDIRKGVNRSLEDFERPVEIRTLPKRPFFHFKTNRKGLTAKILSDRGVAINESEAIYRDNLA